MRSVWSIDEDTFRNRPELMVDGVWPKKTVDALLSEETTLSPRLLTDYLRTLSPQASACCAI
jgi:hypothetical protein